MSALVIDNGAREHIFQFQSRSTLHNGEYAIKKPGCMRFCAGRVCSSVTLTRKIDVDICAHGIWDVCMLHARQSQLKILLNHDSVLCVQCVPTHAKCSWEKALLFYIQLTYISIHI